MKLIKFLILPFLSVLVFAQTATDKKLITAGNYYKNKEYNQVIETLKNESSSDYRVLFFNIASKYELQDTDSSMDAVFYTPVGRSSEDFIRLLHHQGRRTV